MFRTLENYLPKDNFQSHYIMEEAYDLYSGIYTHYDNLNIVRPFAVIAFHPAEERISGSLLDRYLRQFSQNRVQEALSITVGEFLSMDVESVITVLNIARERMKVKEKALKKGALDLDELSNELN